MNSTQVGSYQMTDHRDGFVSAVPILSADEAAVHRAHMEAAEAGYGQLHYPPKIHTLFRDAAEIVMDERLLNHGAYSEIASEQR